MAYSHGKNTLVFWGEYDWSDVFNSVSITGEVETIDVTTFGSANDSGVKAYGLGTPGGSASMSGFWTGPELDLDPDFGDSRSPANPDAIVKGWVESGAASTKPITITHSGTYGTYRNVPDGSRCHILNATASTWNASSPVNDVVALDVELTGQATSIAQIGGFRVAGHVIEHSGPADGSGTNTPFYWASGNATTYSTGAVGTFTQVSATNANDFGAVASIHVLDNTLDKSCAIELWHATDTSGTGAAKFADLYASGGGELAAGTLGSKVVAVNPGVDNTDGCWQVRATPSATITGSNQELVLLVAVAILPYSLF